MTMQVFVRWYYTMITAPVQCDVDGIPKGSHWSFRALASYHIALFLRSFAAIPVLPQHLGGDELSYQRTFIQHEFAIDVKSGVPDEAVEMNGYVYRAAHPRVIAESDVHRT
jgi:hypothetical protein